VVRIGERRINVDDDNKVNKGNYDIGIFQWMFGFC